MKRTAMLLACTGLVFAALLDGTQDVSRTGRGDWIAYGRDPAGERFSPLDGIEPEDLRIAELVERIEKEGTKELVIATNPNTTGEATAMFIAQEVRDLPVRVTALASGLPVGGDLEYADEITLGRAFAGRREL